MAKKYKRTISELNEFKINGTQFDRRVKLPLEARNQLIYIYNKRKELGLKVKDIAQLFGISPKNIYRYTNWDNYLINQRKHSKNYYKNNQKKYSTYKANCLKYKDNLITLIEEIYNNYYKEQI